MAKRLALSGRQKLEKEICHNLSLLGDNTGACEDYIAELEALLRQQKSDASSAQTALAGTENKLAQAMGRIDAQKDDIQTMRTDAKLAALQQATTDKELTQLQTQLDDTLNDGQTYADELRDQIAAEQQAGVLERSRRDAIEKELVSKFESGEAASQTRIDALQKELDALQAEKIKDAVARADLKDELDSLHLTLNEYRECDRALRERIVILEQLLSEERKKAGQDLLLRIMELETMLESERTKVDDLEEMPTVVHVTHSSAAPKATKTTTTVLKTESSLKKTSRGGKG